MGRDSRLCGCGGVGCGGVRWGVEWVVMFWLSIGGMEYFMVGKTG